MSGGNKKKETREFFEQVKEDSPVPEKDIPEPQPDIRNKDGSLKDRIPAKPNDGANHPLGNALKAAKAEIANILKSEDNLKHLRNVLQQKFAENPVDFLMKYGPLLEKYEDMAVEGSSEKGAAVRVLVENNDNNQTTAVEISEGDN